MADTAIEWTDKTWNPVVGCTKVSPGCKNCYAKTLHDQRHKAHQAGKPMAKQYAHPFEVLQTKPERLDDPLRWQRPQRVFVNSVSDLFHKDVPDEFIDRVFGVMGSCEDRGRGHVFQVLTKRAERMADYARVRAYKAWNGPRIGTEAWPARNVWWGVSVEDRKHGFPRIDYLRGVSAAVRFLSVEPLLEDLGTVDLTGIHWVIIGGESGRGARTCNAEWIRSVVGQCRAASVACFVKQLGARVELPAADAIRLVNSGASLDRRRDAKGGDPDEWPADLRVREFPEVRA